MDTLLRLPAVCAKVGLRPSAIYRLMRDQKFPASVRLTERAVAWREADLIEWSRARPSAKPDIAPGCKNSA